MSDIWNKLQLIDKVTLKEDIALIFLLNGELQGWYLPLDSPFEIQSLPNISGWHGWSTRQIVKEGKIVYQ